jgi:glyoxylase-like metal-dependent hydrolase (beta-lactamase superfamily II)
MHPWHEVANGVYLRRNPFLDQTIGAVVGRERVLVIDTRSSTVQARELIEDLRQLTRLPWIVANTHVHFDHAFGNAAFRPCEIWAHEGCAEALRLHGPAQRENVGRWVPDLLPELAGTPLDPPDRTFVRAADLELGDRVVELRHLGRGHTDHDVIVRVPDTGIVFTGDLVEHGAPPGFEDSYPLDWPATIGLLLDLVDGVAVPGHGEPVGRDFVEAQLAEVAYLAETARRTWPELHAAGHDPRGHAPHSLVEDAARHLGWPTEPVHAALGRGLAQAAGRL